MISYDEGTRYKQSAVKNSTTISSNPDMEDKAFVQWVADNVDNNQVTLKGKGAFHEMGVISASTFQMIKDIPVQSLTDKRKASEFVKKRGIQIAQYPGKSHNELLKLTVQPIEPLRLTSCYPLRVQFTLYSLVALQLVFWSIQLQLVRFHAEYHTRMQYSEKISNFLLA